MACGPADADRRRGRVEKMGAVHRSRWRRMDRRRGRPYGGRRPRHVAVRGPRRRNGDRGRRSARQMSRRNPQAERTFYPQGAEALRSLATGTRRPGSARRTASGAHLSYGKPARLRARPRHQGAGSGTHAGATELDLRLAGVSGWTPPAALARHPLRSKTLWVLVLTRFLHANRYLVDRVAGPRRRLA